MSWVSDVSGVFIEEEKIVVLIISHVSLLIRDLISSHSLHKDLPGNGFMPIFIKWMLTIVVTLQGSSCSKAV